MRCSNYAIHKCYQSQLWYLDGSMLAESLLRAPVSGKHGSMGRRITEYDAKVSLNRANQCTLLLNKHINKQVITTSTTFPVITLWKITYIVNLETSWDKCCSPRNLGCCFKAAIAYRSYGLFLSCSQLYIQRWAPHAVILTASSQSTQKAKPQTIGLAIAICHRNLTIIPTCFYCAL